LKGHANERRDGVGELCRLIRLLRVDEAGEIDEAERDGGGSHAASWSGESPYNDIYSRATVEDRAVVDTADVAAIVSAIEYGLGARRNGADVTCR
jgi:hypothetical protein